MPPSTVALATCASIPDLDDDERLLIPALARQGIVASPQVWDDPAVDWREFALVVIRSTWDYAPRRDEFLDWAAALPRVLNTHEVIAWNTDKAYLRELAAAGIAVVSTRWYEPGRCEPSVDLPDGDVVVKPAISAGARDTARYSPGDRGEARAHVRRLLDAGRTVMVQAYVDSVDRHGETGLIHFDGRFSHAIRKGPILPAGDSGRVGSDGALFAVEEISAVVPAADERTLAAATLTALPWPPDLPLYARVDVVRDADGTPMVLEVELTEPSLFLSRGAGAADRLAVAIRQRLATA